MKKSAQVESDTELMAFRVPRDVAAAVRREANMAGMTLTDVAVRALRHHLNVLRGNRRGRG